MIHQKYQNIEIILVNDGSTDGSGAICEEFAQKDPRICVIHQENAGAANAKNSGLNYATGDYITFLDSDDYVEPNWIERMLSVAEEEHADVVECNFDKVFTDHCEVVNHFSDECKLFTAEEYMAQYLNNWTCSLFWNKLFARELVDGLRFRKERRCIDDEFFTYKAITPAHTIARIPDVLYHYRQRKSSAVTSAKNRKQITDDALEILIERYQWIARYFPYLEKTYIQHDVEIMFYFARAFDYTKETARKFNKTSRYYLKQCMIRNCGGSTLRNIVLLQMITTKQLLKEKPIQNAVDHSWYFD